ncbi:hypothetical protein HYT24_03490, partial [Candidatus Pacearchaeota archaeon]|nr:hypothetical protein [Candidatus Pacearchaeota archaeon]
MKYLLTKGEISELINDSGGGLSGEVYLVKHKDKKYILRKCKNIQRAKKYEFVSSKFEKYGFLPKFLG